jgi:hypothetical protein
MPEPAFPTPYPDVNRMVAILQREISAVLGERLLALYLDGSLARGGFDSASDIDFVAVTTDEIDEPLFLALQAMHAAIGALDLPLALEIEGYYLPRAALRRYDPRHNRLPNLERGSGERLKWVDPGRAWIVHRYILRRYGVVLSGPPPAELIDPISPDDLRRGMRAVLQEWGDYLRAHPGLAGQAGYQPYAVLSLCRMLYTLEKGDIASKAAAADWAAAALEPRWQPLIARALLERLAPPTPAPETASETLAFLEYAIHKEQAYRQRTPPD